MSLPKPRPPQPDERDWAFVRELQEPLHRPLVWAPRSPRPGEADLRAGVQVMPGFPDPRGRLETAYADFAFFLGQCGVRTDGPFRIVTESQPGLEREAYTVETRPDSCTLAAADTEGIRRALVFVEDQMQRAGGAFLPLGAVTRTPWVRTRISRCFFGPIKRPPKNRDELADDVDYYPAEYLNRLAHEGVNGLWLTVTFADVCRTRTIPEYGQDAERRLAKLRRTVERCGRYGIRVFAFAIEPSAFPPGSPVLAAHPELGGHRSGGWTYFCASTEAGQRYIEEATHSLFSAVPDLGGLINISVGERPTLCPNAGVWHNRCPRCSVRPPWAVLADSLAAMERGMHAAAPAAELISWSYIPDNNSGGEGWGPRGAVVGAGHIPPGAILQHNFESGGGKRQLGRWRYAGDYWLSYVGPSPRFRACARQAQANGTRMFAKLQVGCSHEVASVPFVPVPGQLYHKYRHMRELGVSGAMQCWYFGNYPGVMNKAAGELAFAPVPDRQRTFAEALAGVDWGEHAPTVARAWQWFARGYSHYPLGHVMGYYGPMANGPVWPLHLAPHDLPLAPTWLLEQYPPSGDRIGECVTYAHSLEEVITLCAQMTDAWERGLALLTPLRSAFADRPERLRDIGLAEALGIQFRSALNIFRFYAGRERLLRLPADEDRLGLLGELHALVESELELDRRLLPLCEADPRLGFHSEAEGYKYHPALVHWRIDQLQVLLADEFPAIEGAIRRGEALFPAYTGAAPVGPAAACACRPAADADPDSDAAWAGLPSWPCTPAGLPADANAPAVPPPADSARPTRWQGLYTDHALWLRIECTEPDPATLQTHWRDQRLAAGRWQDDVVEAWVEPRRLWPHQTFIVSAQGARGHLRPGTVPSYAWTARVQRTEAGWTVCLRIPFAVLGLESPPVEPLRLNVLRRVPAVAERRPGSGQRWVAAAPPTGLPRLLYGTDSPAGLGWLHLTR